MLPFPYPKTSFPRRTDQKHAHNPHEPIPFTSQTLATLPHLVPIAVMTVETHLSLPYFSSAQFNKTREHCITKEDSAEKDAIEFCPDLHYPGPR
jgi:hypothetical protein